MSENGMTAPRTAPGPDENRPGAGYPPTTAPRRSFTRSVAAQRRLHELVPGGSHTYARGSDQYPENMAPILTRGSGAQIGRAHV